MPADPRRHADEVPHLRVRPEHSAATTICALGPVRRSRKLPANGRPSRHMAACGRAARFAPDVSGHRQGDGMMPSCRASATKDALAPHLGAATGFQLGRRVCASRARHSARSFFAMQGTGAWAPVLRLAARRTAARGTRRSSARCVGGHRPCRARTARRRHASWAPASSAGVLGQRLATTAPCAAGRRARRRPRRAWVPMRQFIGGRQRGGARRGSRRPRRRNFLIGARRGASA